MVLKSYVARRHLYFYEDGLFYISDKNKAKTFYESMDLMQRYLDMTCFRYLAFAFCEKGKPTNELEYYSKPRLFKSLESFKLFVVRSQPNQIYYVERGKGK